MKILVSQIKPYLGNIEKNIEKMSENIEKGIREKVDIIVFPELSLTGTMLEDIVYDVAFEKVPEKFIDYSKDITIIFGGIKEENGKFYNTAFCLEDGKVIGEHKKVFLSNSNGGSESRYFTRGKEIKAFYSKHGRIGMLIGEESLNPMVNSILSLDGAKIVFSLINNKVSVKEDKNPYEISAINNSSYNKNYNIVVNRTGIEDGVIFCGESFAVSPYGKIIEKLEQFDEKLSIIDVDLNDIRKIKCSSSLDNENNIGVIIKELNRIFE